MELWVLIGIPILALFIAQIFGGDKLKDLLSLVANLVVGFAFFGLVFFAIVAIVMD